VWFEDWGGVKGRVKCSCCSFWGLLSLLVGCALSLDATSVVVDVDDGAREGIEGDCDWA
jgi:hypothetical protein